MINLLKSLLRFIVNSLPLKLRKAIIIYKNKHINKALIKDIFKNYENCNNKEIQKILKFIKNNGLEMISYDYFIKHYRFRKINVFKDKNNGLFYILQDNKRMYFKRSLNSKQKVMDYYNSIDAEQNKKSPHLYLTDDFKVGGGGYCNRYWSSRRIFFIKYC